MGYVTIKNTRDYNITTGVTQSTSDCDIHTWPRGKNYIWQYTSPGNCKTHRDGEISRQPGPYKPQQWAGNITLNLRTHNYTPEGEQRSWTPRRVAA